MCCNFYAYGLDYTNFDADSCSILPIILCDFTWSNCSQYRSFRYISYTNVFSDISLVTLLVSTTIFCVLYVQADNEQNANSRFNICPRIQYLRLLMIFYRKLLGLMWQHDKHLSAITDYDRLAIEYETHRISQNQ